MLNTANTLFNRQASTRLRTHRDTAKQFESFYQDHYQMKALINELITNTDPIDTHLAFSKAGAAKKKRYY